jgi:hypothetical protein
MHLIQIIPHNNPTPSTPQQNPLLNPIFTSNKRRTPIWNGSCEKEGRMVGGLSSFARLSLTLSRIGIGIGSGLRFGFQLGFQFAFVGAL